VLDALTVGLLTTFTLTVVEAVQGPFVPCTAYVVLTAGETASELELELVFQV
jgi:hypothetical protein